MAGGFDALKNIIMTVVNGQVSPGTIAVQQAQDAIASVMAEAKYIVEMTKIVVPQQAEIAGEIAALEGKRAAKEAEKAIKLAEVTALDTLIDTQERLFDLEKKKEAELKQKLDKEAAKAKARGIPYSPPAINPEDGIRMKKETLDKQKSKSDEIHKEIEFIETDIADIQSQVEEKQKTIKFLTAQLSPAASLIASKVKTQQAQSKVDNAQTPEAKEAAQQELQAAQAEEETMQAISDEHDTSVESNQAQNEPKMMQLRAEYQIMDSGVTVLNYLVTNLPILSTSIMTVPSTIVAGMATGVANPAFGIMWGNVLYGYAFFILATVKAASIRFLALAQEIDYTPTAEMAIINMIAPAEIALKGIMGALPAPAGAALM